MQSTKDQKSQKGGDSDNAKRQGWYDDYDPAQDVQPLEIRDLNSEQTDWDWALTPRKGKRESTL